MSDDAGLQTSGNLLADRRYLYARTLADEGDHAGASELLEQALELAPHWPAAWFALGCARVKLREQASAVAALRQAAGLDPADRIGAGLALASLGAGAIPAAAPSAYVSRLFDDYAGRFESHLLQELQYRGPDLLRIALDKVAPPPRRFRQGLDLGCGTGLAGAALRDRIDHLRGVDLSPAMIARAKAKAIYDDLAIGDLLDALGFARGYEILVAADVLTYFGDLAPVFAAVWSALTPGGLFAFTLQRVAEGEGVRVGADLRFAHAPDFVESCAADAGLSVREWNLASKRRDGGVDVPGLVVVLERADRVASADQDGSGRTDRRGQPLPETKRNTVAVSGAGTGS